jgi:hypothetical protein
MEGKIQAKPVILHFGKPALCWENRNRRPYLMKSASEIAQKINLFLYRQHISKLGPTEIETAREWCMALIRREHPNFTPEEVDRFYENLIHVQFSAVDEWERRMR